MADGGLTEMQKTRGARDASGLCDRLNEAEVSGFEARDGEHDPSRILMDDIRSMRLSHRTGSTKVLHDTPQPRGDQPMLTLYYSPGTVSFVVHVALEEAGLAFELREVALKQGEPTAPEYLAINPLGRVPAVRVESGAVLTEVSAILGFIADRVPERELLPTEPWQRAKGAEWMSLLASSVHPAFIGFFRPQRFSDAPEVHARLQRDSRTRFFGLLQHVDGRLTEGAFALGDRYSLCDPYAALFFMFGRFFEFPVKTLPRYAALSARVFERPAFKKAFAREGLAQLAKPRPDGSA
jgi:glutathione S-transferase